MVIVIFVVIRLVTKIYYLELLHASEGTLSNGLSSRDQLVSAAFSAVCTHSSFKEG
jgi:hypothetical protein